MKIKIVLIVEAMLGGIRQHVCDIARSLDKDKYEVYLIYSDLRADDMWEVEKKELESSLKLILCNEMQREIGTHDVKAYKKIKQIISEINPDIVHCHSSKAGIVGRLAAKRCGIKKIFYTPNAYAFQNPELSTVKRKVYVYAERILSKHTTTLTINVSKGEMKRALENEVDKRDKFTLIYNGIPQIELPLKEELRKELGLKENVVYVGVTARCAEQKDPFTFLQIAEAVIAQRGDIEFVYIGDGPLEEEMRKWVNEKELEDKIHLLGFRKDAFKIVGAFDIYLSTALYEGLPYSMIEAMRAGVPIIATDVVGNNEVVISGRNGKLFPVGYIECAVQLLLRQLTERVIESAAVIDLWKNQFSLEQMMERLCELYEN